MPFIITEKGRSMQIVLIDDDELIHFMWQRQAVGQGLELDCYKSIEEFLKQSEKYDFKTPIYVDDNLGAESGMVDSVIIANLGFTELYLATGTPSQLIEKPSWIKGIQGKRPPY